MLNSGNDSDNVPQDAESKNDLEDKLKEEKAQKLALEENIKELEKVLEELDAKLGPLSTIEFQAYAISRVKPAIDKCKNLCSPSYSRNVSLDYPLHAFKKHIDS